jgi:hypothetical protein
LFFLAPDDEEFHFDDEIPDPGGGTWIGEGWIGIAVGVCRTAPVAAINTCTHCRCQNGGEVRPEIESICFSDSTGERIDSHEHWAAVLSLNGARRLDALRSEIAGVVGRHGIQVLAGYVLDIPVPGLRAGEDKGSQVSV